MTAMRRLAAILAADIAGYSRLMGEDEAGTAQALREHRRVADLLVAKHSGRIVKTAGDGADRVRLSGWCRRMRPGTATASSEAQCGN